MKFTLDTTPAPELETACLVIGVFEQTPLHGSAKLIDQASNGALQQLIESGDVDPFWKHTTMLHGLEGVSAKRILVVGCGEPEKFSAVRYDNVCTSAGAFLRDHATTSAHISLHELEAGGMGEHGRMRQAAVNVDRANYRYTATKAPKDDENEPLLNASFNAGDEMQAALDEAKGLAKGYLRSRELGNMPPNICNPAYIADTAREIAISYDNVSVEILEQDEMADLKMSALLAVGRGSVNGPKLVILKYQGKDEDSQPIVLVGLVCRPLRPEAVREIIEILLVHRLQHHQHRPLQDLVLKGRYPDRAGLAPVSLRNQHSSHWWRKVRPRLEALEEGPQV